MRRHPSSNFSLFLFCISFSFHHLLIDVVDIAAALQLGMWSSQKSQSQCPTPTMASFSSLWLMQGNATRASSDIHSLPHAPYLPGACLPGLPSDTTPLCYPRTQVLDVAQQAQVAACSYLGYDPQEFNKAAFMPQHGVSSAATPPVEFHMHHHHHHYLPQSSMVPYMSEASSQIAGTNDFAFRVGAPIGSPATNPYSSLAVRGAAVTPSYGHPQGLLPSGQSHAGFLHGHEPDVNGAPSSCLQNVMWFKKRCSDDEWNLGGTKGRPGSRQENPHEVGREEDKLLGKNLRMQQPTWQPLMDDRRPQYAYSNQSPRWWSYEDGFKGKKSRLTDVAHSSHKERRSRACLSKRNRKSVAKTGDNKVKVQLGSLEMPLETLPISDSTFQYGSTESLQHQSVFLNNCESKTSVHKSEVLRTKTAIRLDRASTHLQESCSSSDIQTSRRACLQSDDELTDGLAVMLSATRSSTSSSSSSAGSPKARTWKDCRSAIKKKNVQDSTSKRAKRQLTGRKGTGQNTGDQAAEERLRLVLDERASFHAKFKEELEKGLTDRRRLQKLVEMEKLKHEMSEKDIREMRFKKLACQGFQGQGELQDAPLAIKPSTVTLQDEDHRQLVQQVQARIKAEEDVNKPAAAAKAAEERLQVLLDERAWLHAQFKVELDLSSSDRLRLQHLLEVDSAKQVLKGTTEVKESQDEVIVIVGKKQRRPTMPQGLEVDKEVGERSANNLQYEMNKIQQYHEGQLEEGRGNMLDADLLVVVESCDRSSQECCSLRNAPTISEDVSPTLQRQGAATAEANASPSDFGNQTDDRWVLGTTSITLLNDGKVSVEDHQQVSTLIVDKRSQNHPQASTTCSSWVKLLQHPDTHDFLPLDEVDVGQDEFLFFPPTCLLEPEEMALSTRTHQNDSTNLDKGDKEIVQGDHLKSDSGARCLVLHTGNTSTNNCAGPAKYPNNDDSSSKTLDTYCWSEMAPQDITAEEQQEVLRYSKPKLEDVIPSGPQLHSSFCEESPDDMRNADVKHLIWEMGEVTSRDSLESGREICTRRDDLDCGVGSGRRCHGTDTIGAQEAWIQKLVCDPVEILVDPMDESEQSRASSGLFGVTILFESNQQQTAKREFYRLIREHETTWQLTENKIEDMNRRLMSLESYIVKLQENVVIAQTDTQCRMPVSIGRHPVEPNQNEFPPGFTSIYQSPIFVPGTGSSEEDVFRTPSPENGDGLFYELEDDGGSTIFGQFEEIMQDEEVALCDECSEQVLSLDNPSLTVGWRFGSSSSLEQMKQDGATSAVRSMSETHDHPMVEASEKHVAPQCVHGEHDIQVGDISSHPAGESVQLETKRLCGYDYKGSTQDVLSTEFVETQEDITSQVQQIMGKLFARLVDPKFMDMVFSNVLTCARHQFVKNRSHNLSSLLYDTEMVLGGANNNKRLNLLDLQMLYEDLLRELRCQLSDLCREFQIRPFKDKKDDEELLEPRLNLALAESERWKMSFEGAQQQIAEGLDTNTKLRHKLERSKIHLAKTITKHARELENVNKSLSCVHKVNKKIADNICKTGYGLAQLRARHRALVTSLETQLKDVKQKVIIYQDEMQIVQEFLLTHGARQHFTCLGRNQQQLQANQQHNHLIQNMDYTNLCLNENNHVQKMDENAKFDKEHLEEVISINKELLVYAENKEIEVKNMKSEVERIHRELASREESLERLSEHLALIIGGQHPLLQEKERLHLSLNNAHYKIYRLNDQVRQFKVMIHKLETSICSMEATCKEKDEKIQQMKSHQLNINEIQQECITLQSKVQSLEEDIMEKEGQICILKSLFPDLTCEQHYSL